MKGAPSIGGGVMVVECFDLYAARLKEVYFIGAKWND